MSAFSVLSSPAIIVSARSGFFVPIAFSKKPNGIVPLNVAFVERALNNALDVDMEY